MSEAPASFICNPIDLPYRFQHIRLPDGTRTVHREGADPSIVRFRDRYFAFVSMTRGFFHSADLVNWSYQHTDALPAFDYAPDARVIDGALIVTASRMSGTCPFFRSTDPLRDGFVEVAAGSFAFFDPNLFQDQDGEVYLYWGCSPVEPIYATRLDRTTFEPTDERVAVINADTDSHGWEVPGDMPEPKTEEERAIFELIGGRPFIEGAWMTHHDGTYHLQYAAPQTESHLYADGIYTAPTALGPFTYSAHSPYSSKPGGFINGAGHGSTFLDAHGNWWHASTMRISVNHNFERRVGLFPAGFDSDGVLFCNQNFADYPMRMPQRQLDVNATVSPEWMLLSYRADTSASSSHPDHAPELAVNEDIRSWWVAGSADPGQWISLDLGSVHSISAVHLNLADHELNSLVPERADGEDTMAGYRAIDPDPHPVQLRVEVSVDGGEWLLITNGPPKDTAHELLVLHEPHMARFVRVTADGSMPFGAPLALSGVRVFGRGVGSGPDPVTPTIHRSSATQVSLEWPASPDATGYNIRYGIDPDKLYHSWLVYDQADLDLATLNTGEEYWFAVDAFNANGVALGPVTGEHP
ncbi:family 43 glycosylhydrolase [Herbiconiux ginsengi]|uniref:Glycosyl hydrolases family 43 n=1 Tax=Herbiconiux ginsengi TaxID=381665 RepID=A0A1H3TI47_9MICO|nr:family 43 glycosylhydrolase [Herbiconiux ginsengi]SDZ49471.1 Glycosyl hydrolases family 43 [Herbiconiux ginsengi]